MSKPKVRVGVVGYCPPTKFDEVLARTLIKQAYDELERSFPESDISIVSGLTDVGVIGIAYDEAVKRDWHTVGIACKRAKEHKIFPVDQELIVGEEWGEESPAFLRWIDLIIRIGTGPQSIREAKWAMESGKRTIEFNMPALPA